MGRDLGFGTSRVNSSLHQWVSWPKLVVIPWYRVGAMNEKDEFHKRLAKIESQENTVPVLRPSVSGFKNTKIGLVQEKEKPKKSKTKAVLTRIFLFLVIGLLLVRVVLMSAAGMSAERLDERQAELWAGGTGEKAGAIVLMVMGVGDRVLEMYIPVGDITSSTEETEIATLPSEGLELETDATTPDGQQALEEGADTTLGLDGETDDVVSGSDTVLDAGSVSETPADENEYSLARIIQRVWQNQMSRETVPIEDLVPVEMDGWFQITDGDLPLDDEEYSERLAIWGEDAPKTLSDVPMFATFVEIAEASSSMSGAVQLPMTLFFNGNDEAFITSVFVVQSGVLTPEDFEEAMAEQKAEFALGARAEAIVNSPGGPHGFYSEEGLTADGSATYRGMVGPHFTYVFYTQNMRAADLQAVLVNFPFDTAAERRL
ncbi:MAG: hypothetical protein AAGA63_13950 [Pseudomonadota bacterium]